MRELQPGPVDAPARPALPGRALHPPADHLAAAPASVLQPAQGYGWAGQARGEDPEFDSKLLRISGSGGGWLMTDGWCVDADLRWVGADIRSVWLWVQSIFCVLCRRNLNKMPELLGKWGEIVLQLNVNLLP